MDLEKRIEELERKNKEQSEVLAQLLVAQKDLNGVFLGDGTTAGLEKSVIWQLKKQGEKLDALWKKWYAAKSLFFKVAWIPGLAILEALWRLITPALKG